MKIGNFILKNKTENGMSGKVARVKYVVYNFKCGEEKLFLPPVEICNDVKLLPLLLAYFSMGCSILHR